METEEIREKKEPKRLPVWACILLFALGLFVTFGLYSTIGFGVLSLILGDEARHPGLLGHMVAEAGMLLAVPVAAVLFHKLPVEGKKVACVISGGNIDVNILNRVITRGLVMSGRKANLTIALEDKPGQLSLVSDIVSGCGANVVSVHHDRSDANMAITSCFLKLGLETRDAAQIETIKQKLTEAGFKLVTERA